VSPGEILTGAKTFGVTVPVRPSDCSMDPFFLNITAPAFAELAAPTMNVIGLRSLASCSCKPLPPSAGSVKGLSGVQPVKDAICLELPAAPGSNST